MEKEDKFYWGGSDSDVKIPLAKGYEYVWRCQFSLGCKITHTYSLQDRDVIHPERDRISIDISKHPESSGWRVRGPWLDRIRIDFTIEGEKGFCDYCFVTGRRCYDEWVNPKTNVTHRTCANFSCHTNLLNQKSPGWWIKKVEKKEEELPRLKCQCTGARKFVLGYTEHFCLSCERMFKYTF